MSKEERYHSKRENIIVIPCMILIGSCGIIMMLQFFREFTATTLDPNSLVNYNFIPLAIWLCTRLLNHVR